VLGDRQVQGDEVVRAEGDVPADFQGPGDDRLAEVRRWRPELRRRHRERRLPRLPRLERSGDGWLDERVLDEELALRLHPVLGVGHVALRVALFDRAGDLVEPEADETERGASGSDAFLRDQPDRAGDAVADACRSVERDLAVDRAVTRSDQLFSMDRVQRMAALRTRQSRLVEGIEGRWGGTSVGPERPERPEIERQRHGLSRAIDDPMSLHLRPLAAPRAADRRERRPRFPGRRRRPRASRHPDERRGDAPRSA
jgi:hypothetical protein